MNARLSFNSGYNSRKWDKLSFEGCRAIEGSHGDIAAFWDGWNAASDGLENPAADIILTESGATNSPAYLARQCLIALSRDSRLEPGRTWVVPSEDILEKSSHELFPFEVNR